MGVDLQFYDVYRLPVSVALQDAVTYALLQVRRYANRRA